MVIRSKSDTALAIASSGIDLTLLAGGRTAHSTFKFPLNIDQTDQVTCNVGKRSNIAEVLRLCKLIVCDEATMLHKKLLKALHRLLCDLRGNDQLFGRFDCSACW